MAQKWLMKERRVRREFAKSREKNLVLKDIQDLLQERIAQQLAGMDHPFDKPNTKATIIVTIRDVLWQELPESYSEESIPQYRDAVYNYVSQHYNGVA